ncbi:MAG: Gfo/Idh/MocA family protein [Phycisphaerales bacterium]
MGTLGVGIIGYGFMGRTHAAAYAAAAAAGLPCVVRAVCDPSAARLGDGGVGGNLESGQERAALDGVTRHADPSALLADSSIAMVSVCTPTDSHVPVAIAALEAGKHVIVEKPVGLRSVEVLRLAEAARRAGRVCMPAMCMRFWPGWDWLRERIRDREFGAVRSVALTRMGAGPTWSPEFYMDAARSGGPMFDLHVHDMDFLYWCFGMPTEVHCHGSPRHFTTALKFAGGPEHVVAEGAWDLTPTAGFRMRYFVTFEHATAEWDLSRTPRLMLHRAGGSEVVEVGVGAGYEPEVAHFVRCVARAETPAATMEEAVDVTRVLEAAVASLRSGVRIGLE